VTSSSAFPPSVSQSLSAICTTNWDVVIVGAGPASSAAANKLAQMGWQVLVLEHRPERSGYGESLPPFSVNLVRDLLSITSERGYRKAGVRAFPGNKSAWGNEQLETFDFCTHPSGHGLCVDRGLFDQALQQQASLAGACYLFGAKFSACEPHPQNGWRVSVQYTSEDADDAVDFATASNIQLRTRYLADATGRQASVARSIGIAAQRTDKLCAVVQLYRSESSSNEPDYTLLEATENGWWYSNLLPDGQHRIVAFYSDRDLAVTREASTPSGFDALLNHTRHIKTALQPMSFVKCGTLRGTAACSQRLDSFVANGFVAIGDAAQAYDPLSSQGITKALESGVKAGQLVGYALESAPSLDNAPEIAKRYMERYATAQERLWQRYQQHYQYFYQMQSRWPKAEFWQRRSINRHSTHFRSAQHGLHRYGRGERD